MNKGEKFLEKEGIEDMVMAFDKDGWKNFSKDNYKTKDGNASKGYHNCTLTGIY